MEWQPIETAQKDGTVVLVTGPHIWNGQYVETSRIYADRWCITWMDGYGAPTHWMPLPKPPEQATTPTPDQQQAD